MKHKKRDLLRFETTYAVQNLIHLAKDIYIKTQLIWHLITYESWITMNHKSSSVFTTFQIITTLYFNFWLVRWMGANKIWVQGINWFNFFLCPIDVCQFNFLARIYGIFHIFLLVIFYDVWDKYICIMSSVVRPTWKILLLYSSIWFDEGQNQEGKIVFAIRINGLLNFDLIALQLKVYKISRKH